MTRATILLSLLALSFCCGCHQPTASEFHSADASGTGNASTTADSQWPASELTKLPIEEEQVADVAEDLASEQRNNTNFDSTDLDHQHLGNQASRSLACDVVVVCRKSWKDLLEPWIQYRQNQGHQIQWLNTPESPNQLKSELQQRYQQGLRYVLLVGDIPQVGNGISDDKGISTGVVSSEVSYRFGGPELVASDNWYADFDGDHAPEIAIGRWAIDTEEQLEGLIQKTIKFETDPDIEFAKRRVEFVAGVGGFGFLEDKIIETTASRLLTDLLPGHHQVNMTHASWRSVYCPGPDQYQDKFFDSLNRGSLFWVYMGHGNPGSLDNAEFPDRRIATLNVKNTNRLDSKIPPIAMLLACLTGQFAGPQDCLAEQMVAAPHGPVAALAGTGVTAPYGLASFGFEMLSSYRHDHPKVLGDWLVQSKRKMMSVSTESVPSSKAANKEDASVKKSKWRLTNNDYRRLLKQLAGLFSPTSDMLQQELAEHCEMMTLFGDPLLRLPQYDEIQLQANANSDGSLQVSGRLDNLQSAEVQVEIVHPLDRLSFRPTPRNKYDRSAEFHQQFEETYSKANDRVIGKTIATSLSGNFSVKLAELGKLPQRFLVRAFVNSETCRALGCCEVFEIEFANQEKTTTTKADEESETKDPLDGLLSDNDPFQIDGDPIQLYDRKSLEGWKPTNFGGEQEVFVRDDGDLTLETGYPMTGITFEGTKEFPAAKLPTENYELQMRIQKVEGNDFFAGVTFPVGKEPCSFIVGGWGGTTVGLSSIDGNDAARNETRSVHRFESGQWYLLRIRVTKEKIECWIDKEKVVTLDRADHEFSVRNEVRLSMPLGLCNFQTESRVSHFRLLKLKAKPEQEND